MIAEILVWIKRFFKNDEYGKRLAFLRGVPLFHGLSGRQLGRVMLAMQRRTYLAGEKLFEEGQVGKAVFIIKSGQVELTRKVPEGGSRSLGMLGAGQIFGEMALLENLHRTATAVVIESGDIYLLYTSTLESLILRHPLIGLRLMKNMAIMLAALLRKTNRELDRRLKSA